MSDGVRERVETVLRETVRMKYGVTLGDLVSERPPRAKLGDLAFPVAFELARTARTSPRKIAEEMARALEGIDGVDHVEVAGAGYLNVFFDRRQYLEDFLAPDSPRPSFGKVIVEHTNINPNKAAHNGHLRNAALGDTFVRALRYCGESVEVQNYIDDTGVQVADVVVGFLHIENRTIPEVEAIAAEPGARFDYVCWDIYSRVAEFYEEDRERVRLRERTLKAIEEGDAPEGPLAAFIADTIVRCHLATMARIDVRYDLLPWESDILKLKFWERAYQLLKEKGAVRLAASGKNTGCWVMDMGEESGDGDAEAEAKRTLQTRETPTRRSSCGRTEPSRMSARTSPTRCGSWACSTASSATGGFNVIKTGTSSGPRPPVRPSRMLLRSATATGCTT